MCWNLEEEVGHAGRGGLRCSLCGCSDPDAIVGRPSPLSLSVQFGSSPIQFFFLSSINFVIYMAHMLELVVAAIRDCRIDCP